MTEAPPLPRETPEQGDGPPFSREFLFQYKMVRPLGRRSMGAVYLMRQLKLDRLVAVKVVLQANVTEEQTKRLLKEARILAGLNHASIVAIHDVGLDEAVPYTVCEFVEGQTLGHRLRQGPPLSLPDALLIAMGILDGLRVAHEKGVIHRDIKPGNIIVSPDGQRAVLMDLGLAQVVEEGKARLTRTRQFMGTLRYASPEQVLAAGAVDCRSDVYSLGVTLWELLTLGPIFGVGEETSPMEMMRLIQYQEPAPVRQHNPCLSVDLQSIVSRVSGEGPRPEVPDGARVRPRSGALPPGPGGCCQTGGVLVGLMEAP